MWPEDTASRGTSCIQQPLPRAAGPGQTMLGIWPRLVGAPSLKAVVAGQGQQTRRFRCTCLQELYPLPPFHK